MSPLQVVVHSPQEYVKSNTNQQNQLQSQDNFRNLQIVIAKVLESIEEGRVLQGSNFQI